MGFIPGYSLGKTLGENLAGDYYYDQYDIKVDLQKYKQYKGYLDDVSAVTGALDFLVDLFNSAADAAKGLSKSIGSVLGAIGKIATAADILDIGYEYITNRYLIEKAIQYSGAIRGPLKESIFAAKFAEIYMDIMLKDDLVYFEKLDCSHGKEPYTIRWNDEQAKEFYNQFIQNIYDHKRAVIIPENYGKK